MTRFWWVRHGPTHAKGMVGWTDLPADLSDTAQIARLAAFLPDDAIVISSDLARAAATADAIADGRPRLAHDPDLREIHFGAWEMKHHTEIEAHDPHRIRAYWDQPGDVRAPGGETWNEALTRVSAAVDRLIAAHRGADIIAVAHFGAIVTQIQRALDIEAYDAFSHRIDNLSVTQITFDGAWHVGPINHIP
ncbi:MAG: histidine phosphatase family protein [Rhodobacter sp.]|nr:histidine phosphatase family protein [Rhodobacter sp.]